MAKKDEEKVEVEGAPAVETMDGPLLDLNDAGVKRMIKLAKTRGYVTYDELNEVLPSEEVSSDQIEDIYAMLSEMGINVSRATMTPGRGRPGARGRRAEGGELVEAPRPTAVATRNPEPADRTDDPVRMYLREMGSVELLSREGEIAIAKRIEAGRETMIAGLAKAPSPSRPSSSGARSSRPARFCCATSSTWKRLTPAPTARRPPKAPGEAPVGGGPARAARHRAAHAPRGLEEEAPAAAAEADAEDDDDLKNLCRSRRWKPR